jgi:hexosaminidase
MFISGHFSMQNVSMLTFYGNYCSQNARNLLISYSHKSTNLIKMKNNFKSIAASFVVLMLLVASCTVKAPSDLSKSEIIPKPVSVNATGDYFIIKPETAILTGGESVELKNIAQYLADRLKPATGFEFRVSSSSGAEGTGNIILTLAGDSSKLGDEGYEMQISKNELKLIARTGAGLFRGVQTIRQLLPAAIEMNTLQKGPWEIATGTITDYPEYALRGSMLDVSRHFFSVEDVKKYIDEISYYKMNLLHLHLSDDQGWRIEIKSWPNLTAYGSTTQVGGGKGGFYTQEQYSDIVKYALDRYMIIVPEIDMPGHTNAALASYAELNCDGKARDLYSGTEVGFSTFCTKKPVTYKFIDDVVRELAAITPGPYIHIGGDESHSTKKEDYIPFMEKVQDIVAAHGKQVLAWDDIAISKIKPGTVAQHWANLKNATEAVSKGAKILMSPAVKAYLDMQYDSTSKFGLHWAAYIEVDEGYIWDPAKMIPGVGRENIIGVEAPLWSETIATMDEIEYLAFPRLQGIAELGWTSPALRSWDEYKVRLGKHGTRMKAMGIDFYPSKKITWDDENSSAAK